MIGARQKKEKKYEPSRFPADCYCSTEGEHEVVIPESVTMKRAHLWTVGGRAEWREIKLFLHKITVEKQVMFVCKLLNAYIMDDWGTQPRSGRHC